MKAFLSKKNHIIEWKEERFKAAAEISFFKAVELKDYIPFFEVLKK